MSNAAPERTARERLAAERRRAEQRRRRLRAMLISGGALALAAAAVVAVVAVRGGGSDPAQPIALPPVTRQADGSVAMARAGVARPVLEIYEDFQCPVCRKAEEEIGGTLKELAAQGAVRVVYRPFSLFRDSPEPTGGNSKRALNASFCAPAGRWVAYHDKLYAEQGPETSAGFATADLVSWARGAGITDPGFARCVSGNARTAQMDQANQAAAKAGVDETPTMMLNGRRLSETAMFTADGMRRAIQAARQG